MHDKEIAYLERVYKVNEKIITTVIIELKERATAKAAKIFRYKNRTKQFQQNRLFEENRKGFYSNREGKTNRSAAAPDTTEAEKF